MSLPDGVRLAALAAVALVLLGFAVAGIVKAVRRRRAARRDRAAATFRAQSRDSAMALVRGAVWLGAMSREDALRSILLAHPGLSEQGAADLLDRDSQFDAHCGQAGVVDGRLDKGGAR